MLYQCFGRDRRTGEYTKEPMYINATSVDHAFDLLHEMLGHAIQWKSVFVEGDWINSDTGVKPPYQRYDAIADAISEEKKFIAVHEAYHRIMQKHL